MDELCDKTTRIVENWLLRSVVGGFILAVRITHFFLVLSKTKLGMISFLKTSLIRTSFKQLLEEVFRDLQNNQGRG